MHFSICDYLLDGVQNSVEAGASVITVDIIEEGDVLELYIADNGKGMSPEQLEQAMDPFYSDGEKHSSRKVGLGLPFFKQAAEGAGGCFEISSEQDFGTSVFARFSLEHWDCPPLGDLSGTALSLMSFSGDYELNLTHKKAGRKYRISKGELLNSLGDLDSGDSMILARQYLRSLEEDLI